MNRYFLLDRFEYLRGIGLTKVEPEMYSTEDLQVIYNQMYPKLSTEDVMNMMYYLGGVGYAPDRST
jgi:hypothetical protein